MAVISGVSVLKIEVRAIVKGPVVAGYCKLFPKYDGGSVDVMAYC